MLAVAKVDPTPGLRLIERDEPVVQGPTDVLIDVGACGICGADLDFYQSKPELIAMLAGRYPRVLGHEIAGTVLEIGNAVTALKPGDRVACEPAGSCGSCHFCLMGQPNICDALPGSTLGVGRDGGYAKYVVADARQVLPLPPSISFRDASVIETLGVAVRAMERSSVKPGDTAVIIGPGSIGLFAAMLLHNSGVRRLILAGRSTSRARLRLGAELGASTIELDGDNLVEAAKQLSGGPGADVVFDFAGGAESFAQALNAVRKGGEIVLVGLGAPGITEYSRVVLKEVSVLGAVARIRSTWLRALDLVANGVVDLTKVITHTLPLPDYERGFQLLFKRDALKVVLLP